MDFRKAELVLTWYSSSAAQNTFEKSNHAANRTYSDIVIISISLDKARQQGFNAGPNDDLLIEMLKCWLFGGARSYLNNRNKDKFVNHHPHQIENHAIEEEMARKMVGQPKRASVENTSY